MATSFDRFLPRLGTDSIKWDVPGQPETRRGTPLPDGTDLADLTLPLSLADMDFPTAPAIVAALVARVHRGDFGYTFPGQAYFDAVAGWMRRRHAWNVESEWIIPCTGAVPAINLAIQTLTDPGDGVIVQPPVFHPFAQSVANNGRRVVENPLVREGGRYRMDFDDLSRKAADPRTRMLILCSPHNPVGRVWTREELQELVRICDQHDVLIACDEVHCDLTYSWSRFTTLAAAAPEATSRLIHCHGPSKAFNLVGLKASTTIVPDPALRERFVTGLRNLNELFSVGTLGTLALRTAYEQGENWLTELVAYLEGNLRHLRDYLRAEMPEFSMELPDATYLAWVECHGVGMSSGRLKRRLADEARVLLEDGAMYGSGGEGFLRINVACPRRTLDAALDRIRTAVRHPRFHAS
jgi:cystathionine beta-lyase